MLSFLQKLHAIAAHHGDGLRPEFLNIRAVQTLSVILPSNGTEPATPFGNGSTSVDTSNDDRPRAKVASTLR